MLINSTKAGNNEILKINANPLVLYIEIRINRRDNNIGGSNLIVNWSIIIILIIFKIDDEINIKSVNMVIQINT